PVGRGHLGDPQGGGAGAAAGGGHRGSAGGGRGALKNGARNRSRAFHTNHWRGFVPAEARGTDPAAAIPPRNTPGQAVFPAHYPLFAVLPPAMRHAPPARPKQETPSHPSC